MSSFKISGTSCADKARLNGRGNGGNSGNSGNCGNGGNGGKICPGAPVARRTRRTYNFDGVRKELFPTGGPPVNPSHARELSSNPFYIGRGAATGGATGGVKRKSRVSRGKGGKGRKVSGDFSRFTRRRRRVRAARIPVPDTGSVMEYPILSGALNVESADGSTWVEGGSLEPGMMDGVALRFTTGAFADGVSRVTGGLTGGGTPCVVYSITAEEKARKERVHVDVEVEVDEVEEPRFSGCRCGSCGECCDAVHVGCSGSDFGDEFGFEEFVEESAGDEFEGFEEPEEFVGDGWGDDGDDVARY